MDCVRRRGALKQSTLGAKLNSRLNCRVSRRARVKLKRRATEITKRKPLLLTRLGNRTVIPDRFARVSGIHDLVPGLTQAVSGSLETLLSKIAMSSATDKSAEVRSASQTAQEYKFRISPTRRCANAKQIHQEPIRSRRRGKRSSSIRKLLYLFHYHRN